MRERFDVKYDERLSFWPVHSQRLCSSLCAEVIKLICTAYGPKYRSPRSNLSHNPLGRMKDKLEVGQCPTWWPPCRIWVAPSVQRLKVWLTPTTGVPYSNAAKTPNPLGCPKLYRTDLSRSWAEVHHIVGTSGGDIAV